MFDSQDSDTDSKDILCRAVPPSNMVAEPIPGRPIARLYCKNRFEYLISKTRILIGRSGGDVKANSPEVDVSIDCCSLYISRRHFDIFTNDCVKFFVSVYSKNGLFVNGLFLRRGSAAFQLKNQSRLRFPKTDLKILFQIFERENEQEKDTNHKDNTLNVHTPKEENGRGDADQMNDNLPSTLQAYNSVFQQQQHHQVEQPQPQQQVTQPILSPVSNPDKNIDQFSSNVLGQSTKLEREVFKHQLQQSTQLQMSNNSNNLNNNNNNRKRKFNEIPELMTSNHQQLLQDFGSRGDYSDGRKPPFSYSQLIAQAIFSTPDHMLCLNDIYMFITKTYPFYRPEEKGWQNSIRHNLSLSKSFVRMPRANDEGKGSLWTIQYNDKQNMMKTAYRPRGTREKYNQQHTPTGNKHTRILTESMSSIGDSEDSQDMYQNEDEEAANSITMSGGQVTSGEGFSFAGVEQFGEGDADQLGKPTQAAILQSSFANPMQIFMQPDKRGIIGQQQQQQQQQQLNLAQLQRAKLSGSGSVQVVRLTVNPNNNSDTTNNFQSFQKSDQQESTNATSWQQQQSQPQQIFIQQQHQQPQIRIQQQQQSTSSNTGSNQRIIILRPAQQQQQNASDATNTTAAQANLIQQPKKFILASGSNLSMVNGSNDNHQQQQRIIFTQQAQAVQQGDGNDDDDDLHEQLLQDSGLNVGSDDQQQQQQSLPFEMLTLEQQQQILLELQKQQQAQEQNDLLCQQQQHNGNIEQQHQQQEGFVKERMDESERQNVTADQVANNAEQGGGNVDQTINKTNSSRGGDDIDGAVDKC